MIVTSSLQQGCCDICHCIHQKSINRARLERTRRGTHYCYHPHTPLEEGICLLVSLLLLEANVTIQGSGQTHHFALSVPDEATQLEWREKIARAGIHVSPVMDRVYFKSIYTRDPDGHIVELATAGPGFTVDEAVEELGQHLMLPPWLESQRSRIETSLRPIRAPEWNTSGRSML
jgi:hypothetical protein